MYQSASRGIEPNLELIHLKFVTSTLAQLIKDNLPHHVDLSIFAPLSARLRKRLRFQLLSCYCLLLNDHGELVHTEISGLESYEAWLQNFKVLRTCLVTLDAVE
eukprot:3233903-Amphidinium_carterae.1